MTRGANNPAGEIAHILERPPLPFEKLVASEVLSSLSEDEERAAPCFPGTVAMALREGFGPPVRPQALRRAAGLLAPPEDPWQDPGWRWATDLGRRYRRACVMTLVAAGHASGRSVAAIGEALEFWESWLLGEISRDPGSWFTEAEVRRTVAAAFPRGRAVPGDRIVFAAPRPDPEDRWLRDAFGGRQWESLSRRTLEESCRCTAPELRFSDEAFWRLLPAYLSEAIDPRGSECRTYVTEALDPVAAPVRRAPVGWLSDEAVGAVWLCLAYLRWSWRRLWMLDPPPAVLRAAEAWARIAGAPV